MWVWLKFHSVGVSMFSYRLHIPTCTWWCLVHRLVRTSQQSARGGGGLFVGLRVANVCEYCLTKLPRTGDNVERSSVLL